MATDTIKEQAETIRELQERMDSLVKSFSANTIATTQYKAVQEILSKTVQKNVSIAIEHQKAMAEASKWYGVNAAKSAQFTAEAKKLNAQLEESKKDMEATASAAAKLGYATKGAGDAFDSAGKASGGFKDKIGTMQQGFALAGRSIGNVTGFLGKYFRMVGGSAITMGVIIEKTLKYNQALLNVSRSSRIFGSGFDDLNKIFASVHKNTSMSRIDFLEFAEAFNQSYVGIKPTGDAIVGLAAKIQQSVGPSMEKTKESLSALMTTQAQLPSLYNLINRAHDAMVKAQEARAKALKSGEEKDFADYVKRQRQAQALAKTAAVIQRSSAFNISNKDQDENIKFMEVMSDKEKERIRLNKNVTEIQRNIEDTNVAAGQAMEEALIKVTDAVKDLTAQLKDIPKVVGGIVIAFGLLGGVLPTLLNIGSQFYQWKKFLGLIKEASVAAAAAKAAANAIPGGATASTKTASTLAGGLGGLGGVSGAPVVPPGRASTATAAELSAASGGLRAATEATKAASKMSVVAGTFTKTITSKIPIIGAALSGVWAGGSEYMERKKSGQSTDIAAGAGVVKGGVTAGVTLGGTAAGAAAGALIGSIVPVIGTAIGGLVGGIVGAIGGGMGGERLGGQAAEGIYGSATGPGEPVNAQQADESNKILAEKLKLSEAGQRLMEKELKARKGEITDTQSRLNLQKEVLAQVQAMDPALRRAEEIDQKILRSVGQTKEAYRNQKAEIEGQVGLLKIITGELGKQADILDEYNMPDPEILRDSVKAQEEINEKMMDYKQITKDAQMELIEVVDMLEAAGNIKVPVELTTIDKGTDIKDTKKKIQQKQKALSDWMKTQRKGASAEDQKAITAAGNLLKGQQGETAQINTKGLENQSDLIKKQFGEMMAVGDAQKRLGQDRLATLEAERSRRAAMQEGYQMDIEMANKMNEALISNLKISEQQLQYIENQLTQTLGVNAAEVERLKNLSASADLYAEIDRIAKSTTNDEDKQKSTRMYLNAEYTKSNALQREQSETAVKVMENGRKAREMWMDALMERQVGAKRFGAILSLKNNALGEIERSREATGQERVSTMTQGGWVARNPTNANVQAQRDARTKVGAVMLSSGKFGPARTKEEQEAANRGITGYDGRAKSVQDVLAIGKKPVGGGASPFITQAAEAMSDQTKTNIDPGLQKNIDVTTQNADATRENTAVIDQNNKLLSSQLSGQPGATGVVPYNADAVKKAGGPNIVSQASVKGATYVAAGLMAPGGVGSVNPISAPSPAVAAQQTDEWTKQRGGTPTGVPPAGMTALNTGAKSIGDLKAAQKKYAELQKIQDSEFTDTEKASKIKDTGASQKAIQEIQAKAAAAYEEQDKLRKEFGVKDFSTMEPIGATSASSGNAPAYPGTEKSDEGYGYKSPPGTKQAGPRKGRYYAGGVFQGRKGIGLGGMAPKLGEVNFRHEEADARAVGFKRGSMQEGGKGGKMEIVVTLQENYQLSAKLKGQESVITEIRSAAGS